ncbi:MAG: GNAT family N-acetyltransferase, partial [Chloroflexota bacterium]
TSNFARESKKLVPANKYTVEQLTDIYNQTRVDYMVPMPMNPARLTEYIALYQVDLAQSIVVTGEGESLGLAMLAFRDKRSWITRMGLVTNTRGRGVGQFLLNGLLLNSDNLMIEKNMLEVIKGNKPALNLFKKINFTEQRELLILRPAPSEVPQPSSKVTWLEHDECLEHLVGREDSPAWTNQTESLDHAKGINGLRVTTVEGKTGWLVFQRTMFNLSRILFCTGDNSSETMKEMLQHLHGEYPNLDTITENIPADDPHMPAFEELGYIETFRRIEMYRFPYAA